jgi:hypothetical protein
MDCNENLKILYQVIIKNIIIFLVDTDENDNKINLLTQEGLF